MRMPSKIHGEPTEYVLLVAEEYLEWYTYGLMLAWAFHNWRTRTLFAEIDWLHQQHEFAQRVAKETARIQITTFTG